jgi:hypothetical protein
MSYFTLMDFSDGVLRDAAWANTQPNGSRVVIVEGKGDSIKDQFSIALGQGRNGSNALRVRSVPTVDGVNNLPGFWVIPYLKTASGLATPRDSRGYMVPPGTRVNRFGCWLKFPVGFQQSYTTAIAAGTKNFNFNIGTYHVDPGKIDGTLEMKETDNWHGYYQVTLRHDLAQGDWIHMMVNEMPSHQRNFGQFRVPNRLTASAGGLWDTLTRLYLDTSPYKGDPEVPYPVDMLVDSMYLGYVDEDMGVTVQIENFGDGQDFTCISGQEYSLNVTVTNTTASAVTGRIYMRSHYSMKPQLLDAVTGVSVQNTDVTIAPNSSKLFIFKITPASTNNYLTGVVFSPSSQNIAPMGPLQPNISDQRTAVSMSLYGQFSPWDGKLASASIKTRPQAAVTLPLKPWSQGGKVYYGAVGGNITGTLPGSSPSGETLTFSKVSQQSTGGNITINSNGQFTFAPTAGFTGAYFFRYKINDGYQDSNTFGAWAYAGEDESGGGTEPPTPPPPVVEMRVQMTGAGTAGFSSGKLLVR